MDREARAAGLKGPAAVFMASPQALSALVFRGLPPLTMNIHK
jgi:hypothetical protein